MGDLVSHLTNAPIANILVLTGIAFIAVAVLGHVTAQINPGKTARIAAAVVGAVLIAIGLVYHGGVAQPRKRLSGQHGAPVAAGSPGNEAKPEAGGAPSTQTSSVSSASSPAQDFTPFLGDWQVKRAAGRAISRLQVRQSGGQLLVHAWANCSNPDCDWGERQAEVSGNSAKVTFTQGTASHALTIMPGSAGELVVQVHFTDSGKSNDFRRIFLRSPAQ